MYRVKKDTGWLAVLGGLLLVFYCVPLAGLQHARSPRFMNKADPEYQYLFAGLNMARLDPVYYSDHPGSTVQMLGAVCMHAAHLFSDNPDLLNDVLRNPEYYLDVWNTGLIVCYLLALCGAAWLVLRLTGEPLYALVMLMSPLLCFFHFSFALAQVRSEAVLFTASVLLGVCVIALQSVWRQRRAGWLACAAALVIGFGAATKLAFLPLAVFPLLALPTVRWRAVYCGAAPLAFLAWLGPALPTYDLAHRILPWLKRSGTCGIGDSVLLGSHAGRIWREMVQCEYPFLMLAGIAGVMCVAALVAQLVRRQRPAASTGILAALLLAITLQILVSIRAGMPNYIISSSALGGTVLVLALQQLALVLPRRVARIAAYGGVFAVTAWSVWQSVPLIRFQCVLQLREQAHLLALRDVFEHEYREYIRVHYYYHGFLPFALYFGNGFANHQYAAELDKIYPDTLFWVWDVSPPGFLRGFSRQRISFDQLWFENPRIIMAGSSASTEWHFRPPVPVREVMRASDAALTMIDRERIWTNELLACERAASRGGWAALQARAPDAVFHARFDAVAPDSTNALALIPAGLPLVLHDATSGLGLAWDVCGFRAANRRLECPAPLALATGSCTVAALLRIGDKPGWQIPFGHGWGTANSNSPWFVMCDNNQSEIHFVMQFNDTNGTPRELRIGHRLPPSEYPRWHVLAGTYSSHDNTLALYVDGTRAGTASAPAGARRITNPAPLTIGSLAGGNLPFLGYIREVLLFDRALTENELNARAVP